MCTEGEDPPSDNGRTFVSDTYRFANINDLRHGDAIKKTTSPVPEIHHEIITTHRHTLGITHSQLFGAPSLRFLHVGCTAAHDNDAAALALAAAAAAPPCAARSHEPVRDAQPEESVAHDFEVMDGSLRVHCGAALPARPADGLPVHAPVGGAGAARADAPYPQAGERVRLGRHK